MDLSAPTLPVFVLSLIVAVIALLGAFDVVPIVKDGVNAFWAAILAYAILMAGNLAKGL